MELSELTLEEKVGQMFMCGIQDENHLLSLINNLKVGGIIYFNRNVNDAKDALELSNKIKSISKIPLFISIDQEGGIVSRIKKNITEVSGNMAIAATNNKENAYKISKILAEELSQLGINMNLAPVVDINNNPNNPVINVRSYGENPNMVTDFGLKSLNGYKEKNIIAVAKHFPGHGDTDTDSHTLLPIVDYNENRLNNMELIPYKRMIPEGLDGIMVSHILFSKICNDNKPATLSYDIITKLLKQKLNYKGLIITDCMEMQAITDNYGMEDAVIASILAGVDIIAISHTLDLQDKAIKAVIESVKNGVIDEDIINQAVNKILKYKKKYNITNVIKDWEQVKDVVNTLENNKLSKEISLSSITLVKDDNSLIPINKEDNNLFIVPKIKSITMAEDSVDIDIYSEKKFDIIYYDLNLSDLDIKEIAIKADMYDKIIFGSYNINLYNKQLNLFNTIKNDNCILVSLRSPYDYIYISKKVSTYICCYEATKLAIDSLFKILFGEEKVKGSLPVSLTNKS